MSAVIFDTYRLADTGPQDNLQLAQVGELGLVSFVRWQAFDPTHEVEQSCVVQIGILVVIRIDLAIHERQARRIWDAVIGGFVRLRPPLVRSVGHDLDRGARRMDVDLQDFVRTLEIGPCFHGSLRDSLGKLVKRNAVIESTADSDRHNDQRLHSNLSYYNL